MNSDILFTSTINDYLLMDHNGDHLHTLADNFQHASLDMLKNIELSLEGNDHGTWSSDIHTLKGIAGVAGARNLHDICDCLRSRNENAFIDNPNHIMMELRNAIDDYCDAIHKALNASPKKGSLI
jgi:HPt (histidine-containing phosphotransfer) domain-containing protein